MKSTSVCGSHCVGICRLQRLYAHPAVHQWLRVGQGPSALQFRKQHELRRVDGSRPDDRVLLGRRGGGGLDLRHAGREEAGLKAGVSFTRNRSLSIRDNDHRCGIAAIVRALPHPAPQAPGHRDRPLVRRADRLRRRDERCRPSAVVVLFLPCPDNDPASRTPREEAPMQFPTGSVVALSSAAATMFSMGICFSATGAGTSRCRGGSATTS